MFKFNLRKHVKNSYMAGFDEGFRLGMQAGKALAEEQAVITGPTPEQQIEEILRKAGVSDIRD